MARNEAEAVARMLLSRLDCHADLNLLPAYLTPLERTQLAIARAAIMEPAVLFLEEPYHELEHNEHNIINAFLKEWANNRALVISTRNLHFVKQQADQIIFAAAKKILYFDSWEAFNASEEMSVRVYLQQYRENYSI
jgi:ABC-type polar amino acid transport system ATPase subunit